MTLTTQASHTALCRERVISLVRPAENSSHLRPGQPDNYARFSVRVFHIAVGYEVALYSTGRGNQRLAGLISRGQIAERESLTYTSFSCSSVMPK